MMPWLPQTLKFQNCLEGPPGCFSWRSGEHPSARYSDRPMAKDLVATWPFAWEPGFLPTLSILTVYSDCSLLSSSFRVSKGRLAPQAPREWWDLRYVCPSERVDPRPWNYSIFPCPPSPSQAPSLGLLELG